MEELEKEAEDLHNQAMAALEAARKALLEVPLKIKAKEEFLGQKQQEMEKGKQGLLASQQGTAEKQAFIKQVQAIADSTQSKVKKDTANTELSGAKNKLLESLDFLKKDLGNAQAGMASRQEKLKDAQTAVKQAQDEVLKTKGLTQTAPKVVEEKQSASNAPQPKFAEASKTKSDFQGKVDIQRKAAEALLQKYLDALPK